MDSRDLPTGPFTLEDAERLGITRHRLRCAVREGVVRRIVTGVYVRADRPDSHAVRCAAVARVVSPASVVCDRTAAWLHGIDVFGLGDQEVLPPVETCVIRGHARSQRFGVDGRSRDLAPRDLMKLDGLLVTTPLRTALDLACGLGRRRALAALDQFMRIHGITTEQMQREVIRYRGRRGVVQLRELIPLADVRAESVRESWLRLDIIDAGFPPPELQVWVEDEYGVKVYRLDLAYPLHRIAIEYDGADYHLRDEDQRRRDAERRRWLRQHGWTVIVVDKHGLTGRERMVWKQELAEALRPRTKRLRWERSREESPQFASRRANIDVSARQS